MSHVTFESEKLPPYQVWTLGHCCNHGRDMTRPKSALRACSYITEVCTARTVSESLLTSSQRLGMSVASLLFYKARESLKN
jgi:hypothetical protein